MSPPGALSVLMILVLGLADGIHATKTMRRLLAEDMPYRRAISKAVVSNFLPVALTSLTTAIGFVSFNFSGYDAIETMGNYLAFGVMMAFVLSVTLLPALLCFCGVSKSRQTVPFLSFRRSLSHMGVGQSWSATSACRVPWRFAW